MNEREIFVAALKQPSPPHRAAYLAAACGDNAALRDGVESLLREYEQLGSFLEPPPGETLDILQDAEQPGVTLAGRYKLVELLGEGGMGSVWMAQQFEPMKRLVAVKFIKRGMDSKAVLARFEQERQALALMDHPNIARVFDAGTQEGRPYFVMELVRGVLITKYCDEHHLTPRQRLELFISVCQAIQHAHQKGVIHRDIKPSNVLVTLYDGKPVVKVIDFGVAKAAGPQFLEQSLITGFGSLIGTLEYMSPEQAEFNQLDVDTRSDVYSLGVVLYELLTGTTPLPRTLPGEASLLEKLRLIRDAAPPWPSVRLSATVELPVVAANRGVEPRKLTGVLRGELDWIVMKALEKERGRRYQSALSLAQDVQRYLSDEPLLACPPSLGYRLWKFARRNRGALTITGLVLLLLLVLGGGVGWMAHDQTVRRAVAREQTHLALQDALALQRQDKWPEAIEALKRADGFLAGAREGTLADHVRDLRHDVEMVMRLEAIRLPCKVGTGDDKATRPENWAQAFREYGIDLEALDPDEAAARIQARSIRKELIVAVDTWAMTYHKRTPSDEGRRQRLLAVASAADDDGFRNQVRAALARRDRAALLKLVRSGKGGDLPLQTVSLLVASGLLDKPQEHAILRQAHRDHPDDFWINFQLAYIFDFADPPHRNLTEAVRFYTAALASRPRNVSTHYYLSAALWHSRRWDELAGVYERILTLKPDDAKAFNNLAWLLATCPDASLRDPARAVGLARKAVEQEPSRSEHWNTLGIALYRAGDAEARSALKQSMTRSRGGDSFDWFFLAMIAFDEGECEEALRWYQKALAWMAKHKPNDEELIQFRAEAAQRLGVNE